MVDGLQATPNALPPTCSPGSEDILLHGVWVSQGTEIAHVYVQQIYR